MDYILSLLSRPLTAQGEGGGLRLKCSHPNQPNYCLTRDWEMNVGLLLQAEELTAALTGVLKAKSI